MNLQVALGRSLTQLRTNPLRTLLTMLGVVFGVGSVVAMVSIGEGAQRQILEMIDAMGATNVHVVAKKPSDTEIAKIVNDCVGLSLPDAEAVRAVVAGVGRMAFRKTHDLRSGDLDVPLNETPVIGVSEDLVALHGLRVARGRPFVADDHRGMRRVALLGSDLARRAFKTSPVGRVVRLDYTYFEIVGVLAQPRPMQGDLPIDPRLYGGAVVVPYETLIEELEPPPAYGAIDLFTFEVPTLEDTISAKHSIGSVLASTHSGIVDYEIIAPEEILAQKKETQRVLNLVLVAIAAISLLVGGIGVMNIMLANIMERVGEIGLRRALGARRRDIRDQFLSEAIVICCVGGAIGIAIGFAIAFAIAFLVGLEVAFAWQAVFLSFAISFAVGVGFGYVPAMRAANVDPIEALRNE